MEKTLVVLAAGIGRRYGGLKQLESVGPSGEALLEYSIFDALRGGFEHVVLVIRPETEAEFRAFLGPRLGDGVSLSYAFQRLSDLPDGVVAPTDRTKPWGTGHAVLAAEGEVQGPFAVINADDFYGADSYAVLGKFLDQDATGAESVYGLAGFDIGPTLSSAGPVSRGLCRADDEDWLENIVEILKLEKRGAGGSFTDPTGVDRLVAANELVSMNMWGFTQTIFAELKEQFRTFFSPLHKVTDDSSEFLLPTVVQGMINDGSSRVKVLRHDGRWCGITFPEDRDRVRDFIADLVQQGAYPTQLWD